MEGYALEPITAEQRREMLEKAIEKSTQNGTWPMLLAAIGMVLSMGENKN